jgi:hypothetical protein
MRPEASEHAGQPSADRNPIRSDPSCDNSSLLNQAAYTSDGGSAAASAGGNRDRGLAPGRLSAIQEDYTANQEDRVTKSRRKT